MYFEANTFLFILVIITWTCGIVKVSNIFKWNYKLSIFIMVSSVICFGFLYQYLYFLKINSIPENDENYRIKEAFLNYSFKEDGSADIEHKLLFESNKNSRSKNSLSYIFYELDEINFLEVSLNNNSIKPSTLNIPNTYELKTDNNKNVLTFYFPYDSKNIDLTINYSIKNALGKYNDTLVYYNIFFPERTDFSFNTNVKGSITFHYPENSIRSFGANSKDFWVNTGNSHKNSLVVKFKNKLPYEKKPFSRLSNWVKLYDPASYDKSYIKDFSLTTRLDFSQTSFKKELHPFPNELSNKMYSTLKLKSLNKENNEKFSDFKFMLTVFITSFPHGINLFLFISFPIIFFYYKGEI